MKLLLTAGQLIKALRYTRQLRYDLSLAFGCLRDTSLQLINASCKAPQTRGQGCLTLKGLRQTRIGLRHASGNPGQLFIHLRQLTANT
ncbi:hypothetical protein D3C80_1567000 [compost metagenome]